MTRSPSSIRQYSRSICKADGLRARIKREVFDAAVNGECNDYEDDIEEHSVSALLAHEPAKTRLLREFEWSLDDILIEKNDIPTAGVGGSD